MPFDRILGHEELAVVSHPSPVGSTAAVKDWPKNTTAVLQAAACPAHGCCCDEESAEEFERWDGME